MESSYSKQLEKLLGEDLQTIIDREKTRFDEVVKLFGDSLILYGAGQLGRKVLNVLRSAGISPLAFTDSNQNLWDTTIENIKVLSPADAAKKFGDKAAFIVTIWSLYGSFVEINQQLTKLGRKKVVPYLPLFWKYHKSLLPHFCHDLPHLTFQCAKQLRQTFSLWSDEKSQSCFIAFLKWRLYSDYNILPPPIDFYPKDIFELNEDYGFVDCGAFDGDTVTDFVNRRGNAFRDIIAIEPDPVNHQKLRDAVSKLNNNKRKRITLVHAAVGDKKGKISFNACGSMASSIESSGNMSIECITLDDILDPHLKYYIKVDVEGADLNVLMGAKKIIEAGNSIWAMTLEHKYDDLWRIPLFIKSVSNGYNFYLRSHHFEGTDLTCYATPKKIN
ncbi:MAG TPA: FkbM family methyltransferase [Smithella sp.]|nr:FkbM family methyltransferase [Smithella sp.]